MSVCLLLAAWGSLPSLGLATPPAIASNRQPQSQCVIAGQSGTLSVTGQGTAPLLYQWYFNGAILAGATNANVPFRPVRPENGGDYQVTVANAEGSLTSLVARLHVLPVPASLSARIFTNSAKQRLPYRLWIPTNHLNEGPLPLVLFLHGVGERGSDNLLQLTGQPHALSFVSYQNQEAHPCFFVAPQCPTSTDWSQPATVALMGGMVSNLLAEFSIDTNRLYVTGLSMGGYGTWALLTAAPGAFAAAAPVCGGWTVDAVPYFKNTPIWDFHSADDPTVPVKNSRDLVEALRRQGGEPIYTEYASAGHFAWVPTYSNQKLIDWMMAQRLGERKKGEPAMTFPEAYDSRIARAPVGYFDLQGTATAFGENITNIVWTNQVLRAGGRVTGTNEWLIENVALSEQETNVITVIAKTSSWAPQYGGSTSISKTVFVRGLPPLLLTLESNAGQTRLSWSGGEPPYCVQSSPNLGSGTWVDYYTNAVSPVILTSDGSRQFYRVICP